MISISGSNFREYQYDIPLPRQCVGLDRAGGRLGGRGVLRAARSVRKAAAGAGRSARAVCGAGSPGPEGAGDQGSAELAVSGPLRNAGRVPI